MSLYFTLDPLSMLCLQKSKQHGVFCLKAAKLIFFPVQLIDWGLPLEHVQLNCSQFLHNELNWKWKRLNGSTEAAYKKQIILNYESCKAALIFYSNNRNMEMELNTYSIIWKLKGTTASVLLLPCLDSEFILKWAP